MKTIVKACLPLVLFLVFSFEMPKGWYAAGSMPEKYEMGLDPSSGIDGKNAATIRSVKKNIKGFGTLMQTIDAGKYEGKRIRMSGYIKTKDVKRWAGFWLRVDQKKTSTPLAFDNMSNRPVRGTTDWTKYDVVLDVGADATMIAFGGMLNGEGQIWFDNITLDVVDKSVPVTDMYSAKNKYKNSQPVNLGFDD